MATSQYCAVSGQRSKVRGQRCIAEEWQSHAIVDGCVQQSMTEAEALVVEQALEKEQALMQEAHRCRQNVHHLRRLTQIKVDERQQKSGELIRAQVAAQGTEA